MKDWWKYLLGMLLALLAGGVIVLVSSPPRGEPIVLLPPPTPAPIQVHIAGAVVQPGVYSLPHGGRIQDAVTAAGGLSPEADSQRLNLAAFVKDGEQVVVPALPTAVISQGYPVSPSSGETIGQSTNPARSGSAVNIDAIPTGQCTDINHASQAELESLPYIGPKTAQKIIAYRDTHGPFPKLEAIIEVDGIGPKTFEQIKNLICVK